MLPDNQCTKHVYLLYLVAKLGIFSVVPTVGMMMRGVHPHLAQMQALGGVPEPYDPRCVPPDARLRPAYMGGPPGLHDPFSAMRMGRPMDARGGGVMGSGVAGGMGLNPYVCQEPGFGAMQVCEAGLFIFLDN